MQGLTIDTGIVRLAVNNDPERVIEFNPKDQLFAEKFYRVYEEIIEKEKEISGRVENFKENMTGVDEQGIPVNIKDGIELWKDTGLWVRDRIDYVFGEGTSQKAFGDAIVFEAFQQFFEGVTPFIQSARSERMEKYTGKKGSRVMQ